MVFAKKLAVCLLLPLGIWCCGPRKDAIVFAVGGAPSELLYWESLCREFENRYRIPVELLRQPSDTDQRRQSLVVSLSAGMPNPDVFLMDVAWLGFFSASSWLEPLGDHINPQAYFPEVLALADRFRGRLYALPVYLDGGVLYYRKDLLDRFGFPGPPKTWMGLLEMARRVQKEMRRQNPRFFGFVWQGAQYEGLICNFLEFCGANGGFSNPDDRIRIDLAANRDALIFMRDLIWKHQISPPNTYTEMKEEEARTYFQAANALFERNWPYAWALHQSAQSAVRGKIGVAPLPAPPDGDPVSTLGGWHIGISAFSDRKADALKFVEYVCAYETQKKLVLQLGWNPGRLDLYTDPDVLSRAPHLAALKEVFRHARPRPVVPFYTQLSTIAQRHINAVLADRNTAEQALKQAQEEIDALLERYGDTASSITKHGSGNPRKD